MRETRWIIAAGVGCVLAIAGGVAVVTNAQPEATPASCTQALDKADEIRHMAADGFGLTADMIKAAGDQNTTKLSALTVQLKSLNVDTNAAVAVYQDLAGKCRG